MPSNQLYVCVNKVNHDVFFASMAKQKDMTADFRTSYGIDKGMSLMVMPVPDDWKGGDYEPDDIIGSKNALEAHVIYTEGRGQFRIRILSGDQQDMVDRVRSGSMKENVLRVEVKEIGAIYEVLLKGRLGVDSVGKVQRALRGLPDKVKPLLFDFSGVTYMAKDSFGVLSEMFEHYRGRGYAMSILVPAESRAAEILGSSRLSAMIEIYSDREQAVTALLMRSFT